MTVSLCERVIGFLIVTMLVVGCAGVQQKTVVLEPGEKTIVMKVGSFKFEPNDIKVHRGDVLTVKLENSADTEHNITITTPQGATLVSQDIPANGTVSVKVNLAETGTYHFHCDKPFHSTLGMKGQIEVTAP